MFDYFSSEPMKYYSMSSSMTREARKLKLEQMIDSEQYLFGLKTDGNWSRAIITSERNALQTRGISKVTGTYGQVEDKVFFWNNVVNAFQNGTTVILGEIFMPNAIDRQVGSILRCLKDKALERQKEQKLRWRIFDILCYDGIDLMNIAFEERIKYIPKAVERIHSPLVEGVTYKEMNQSFFEEMGKIFAAGLEGAVCYKKNAIYIPGKRGPHAWDSVKVKQEISNDIDALITKLIPCEKNYNGHELATWKLWQNTRTEELTYGEYFGEYQLGGPYEPISKNFYNNWPGAIEVSVYNANHELVPICSVAGLTEEFKAELRDHFDELYLTPIKIGGMMVSTAQAESDGTGISIRHPYIKSIRKNDINPEDCTLSKILS